jgi:hypothetical protein
MYRQVTSLAMTISATVPANRDECKNRQRVEETRMIVAGSFRVSL